MIRPSLEDYATYGESAFPGLWDGVIGAWSPCLGPTGSRLHDFSRFNRWGTLTSMDPPTDWVVSNVSGSGVYALDFDGVNDYVTTSASLSSRNVVGISLWYWRATNSESFYCGGGAGGQQGPRANIYLLGTALYMTAETDVSGAAFILATVNNSGWMHLFYRFNGGAAAGSRLQPYLNGSALSFSVTGTLASTLGTVGNFEIGRSAGESRFGSGRVAEAVAWSRDLSAAEILQLNQIGPGGMFQRRKRRYSIAAEAAPAFRAPWATRSHSIIGGGIR